MNARPRPYAGPFVSLMLWVGRRVLAFSLPSTAPASVVSDLHDEFDTDVLPRRSRLGSSFWYVRELASLVGWYTVARVRGTTRTRGGTGARPPKSPARRSPGRLMDQLRHDTRFAVRDLKRRPGFAAVAVLILTLGIAGGTTIFSAIRALSKGLPVSNPDELVRVFWSERDDAGVRPAFSYPDYVDLERANTTLKHLTAFANFRATVERAGDFESAAGELVAANFFRTLGITPRVGRAFTPGETRPGGPPVVVISHALRSRLAAESVDILGQTITLNGRPFTVIGVAPTGFHGTNFASRTDLWIPLAARPLVSGIQADWMEDRTLSSVRLIGRLGVAVGRENAEADLNTAASRIAPASLEADRGRLIHVLPERAGLLNPNMPSAITAVTAVALAMVGLLVVVACANVASLLLARASARRREIGIRLSLGASRIAIARQLLIEVLVLTGAAGGIGLLISLWSTKIYTAFLPSTGFPLDLSFAPDLGAVGFTVGLSLGAAAIAGVAPALHGARTDLVSVLKSDAALGGARAPRRNFLNRVITTQFACAVVILVVAGLLTRTMMWFQRVELGYAVDNRVISTIDLGPLDYTETRGRLLYADLAARFEALPEVTEVSLAASRPLSPFSPEISIRTSSGPLVGADALVAVNVVSPAYAPSMDIPIVRGRNFQPTDTEDARRVAIVNEMFASRFWPTSDPVGQLLSVGEGTEQIEVVGVVPDVKTSCLACSPRPDLYLPFTQHYRTRMTLHLVTTDPDGLVPRVRPIIAGLDPRLAPRDVMTVSDWIDVDRWLARTAASLAAVVGALAIVFASIGLYGVMAFAVTRRTREIGIRVALGAEPRDVLRLIVGHATRIAFVALAIGMAVAIAAARVLRGVLFGVSPNDPTTYLVVAILLVFVATLASYLPARRAIRLDPTIALRQE